MGKAQSTLGFISKLVFGFGFSQLSKVVYKSSLSFFPGLVFVVFAGLYLANAVTMVFVRCLLKLSDEQKSDEDDHDCLEEAERLDPDNEGGQCSTNEDNCA